TMPTRLKLPLRDTCRPPAGEAGSAKLSKRTWPVKLAGVAVRKPGFTADAVPSVVRPVTEYDTGASTVVPVPTPVGPKSTTENVPWKLPEAVSVVVKISPSQSPAVMVPVNRVLLVEVAAGGAVWYWHSGGSW